MFFCCLARHRFPLQSPAMSLRERGPIEKHAGSKMLLVRAHQCSVFPRWMACQWRVEMGFVWAVGQSCVGTDNGWQADVKARECTQGSSSVMLWRSWKSIPFIYTSICSSLNTYAYFFTFLPYYLFNFYFGYAWFLVTLVCYHCSVIKCSNYLAIWFPK